MPAKERGRSTGRTFDKKLTLGKNILLAILCYKYQLMRPSKGFINLANLRFMFGYLFEEIEFTANAKNSMQVLHAQQPCKNFTHLIWTAVFSATSWCVIAAQMPATVLNIVWSSGVKSGHYKTWGKKVPLNYKKSIIENVNGSPVF